MDCYIFRCIVHAREDGYRSFHVARLRPEYSLNPLAGGDKGGGLEELGVMVPANALKFIVRRRHGRNKKEGGSGQGRNFLEGRV